VYGLSNAATDSDGGSHWGDAEVVVSLVAAVLLLATFVTVERRSAQPLLPMRILLDRMRGGSYLTMLCLATAMFGLMFFLTLFMQNVLGYSPLESGLAFLPFAAMTVGVSEIVARIVARTGPRTLLLAGAMVTAGGIAWFSALTERSSYVGGVLAPMVVTAAGFGLMWVPLTLTATSQVDPADAGVAASLLNTGQQVGGAIGLASLGTVVWTVVANRIDDQISAGQSVAAPPAAMVDQALAAGFSRGFLIAGGVTVLALGVVAALMRRPCPIDAGQPPPPGCPGTHWRRPRT
jgi:predicted MFS family arabinose efflux permease